jgi:hypothetical protein
VQCSAASNKEIIVYCIHTTLLHSREHTVSVMALGSEVEHCVEQRNRGQCSAVQFIAVTAPVRLWLADSLHSSPSITCEQPLGRKCCTYCSSHTLYVNCRCCRLMPNATARLSGQQQQSPSTRSAQVRALISFDLEQYWSGAGSSISTSSSIRTSASCSMSGSSRNSSIDSSRSECL